MLILPTLDVMPSIQEGIESSSLTMGRVPHGASIQEGIESYHYVLTIHLLKPSSIQEGIESIIQPPQQVEVEQQVSRKELRVNTPFLAVYSPPPKYPGRN